MRLYLAAALEWRTLLWLGAGLLASVVLANPFPAVIGFGIYLWAAKTLAGSKRFQEAAEAVRMAEAMAKRYTALEGTARSITPRLPNIVPAGQHRSWAARVADVLTATRGIYQEWLSQPQEQADHQAAVEQAIQLADLYLRIVRAYLTVYTGRKPVDMQNVAERMERNQRKLAETSDQEARRLLDEAIAMDEKVLAQQEHEEADRERYLAKLAAIESAMDLLRRQIFDPEATPDGNNLQDILLEAQATDEALREVEARVRVRS
ncbi:MAG: hypothetical protein ACM3XM_07920 [Mycobacterium leprae]